MLSFYKAYRPCQHTKSRKRKVFLAQLLLVLPPCEGFRPARIPRRRGCVPVLKIVYSCTPSCLYTGVHRSPCGFPPFRPLVAWWDVGIPITKRTPPIWPPPICGVRAVALRLVVNLRHRLDGWRRNVVASPEKAVIFIHVVFLQIEGY
jgi:hypothetical protein